MRLVNCAEKLPIPLPDTTFASLIVGSGVTLYTTPRSVTGFPRSSVTSPTTTADAAVTFLTDEVATTGAETETVVKLTSSPYVVPSLFTA